MKKLLIILAMLAQACSADGPLQSLSGTTIALPHEQSEDDQAARTDDRKDACTQALSMAEKPSEGDTLSAFRTFNDYPPTANTKNPGEVTIALFSERLAALSACLPMKAFSFTVLTDGVLEEGGDSQIFPLSIWEVPGGYYLVSYLHGNYEMSDGEGDSVEISGIILDGKGQPLKTLRGLSSWYEYEGSIRIRDLWYSNGKFVATEEVFDPTERDKTGRVLGYVSDHGKRIIKEYYVDGSVK